MTGMQVARADVARQGWREDLQRGQRGRRSTALGRLGGALAVLAVLMGALATVGARATAAQDAATFLASLSERAVAELSSPSTDEVEREKRFRVLLSDGFDLPAIGRFVLGRYWRVANEREREEFLATFEDLIVSRFLPFFAQHNEATLVVGRVRPEGGESEHVIVTSKILRPGKETVAVEWRIHESDGSYKIVDVIAEGVSIAITLRSEYASVIQRNGGKVSILIEMLREKIATGPSTS